MTTLPPDLQRYRAELRDAIETDLDRRRGRRRTKKRMVRIGVPGLAVSLGLSLTLVLAGTQEAFAGWSPSPTLASAGQTSSADATCQAQLAASPPPSTGGATAPGWNVVTTDVRGPFTLVIYQNGTAGATCLTGPSITVVSQDTASGGSVSVSRSASVSGGRSGSGVIRAWSMLRSASSGSVEHMTLAHFASTDQGPFTVVQGQVDAGVTGVSLVLSDGEHVQASTGHGWFVAWWPGLLDATSVEITTASGVTTQTLTPLPVPPLPANHSSSCQRSQGPSSPISCTGGAVGSGSGGPTTATVNGTGNS